MAMIDHQQANDLLKRYREARDDLEERETATRNLKLALVGAALRASWSYERIGWELGQSGTAVRRWYERQRNGAHSA